MLPSLTILSWISALFLSAVFLSPLILFCFQISPSYPRYKARIGWFFNNINIWSYPHCRFLRERERPTFGQHESNHHLLNTKEKKKEIRKKGEKKSLDFYIVPRIHTWVASSILFLSRVSMRVVKVHLRWVCCYICCVTGNQGFLCWNGILFWLLLTCLMLCFRQLTKKVES